MEAIINKIESKGQVTTKFGKFYKFIAYYKDYNKDKKATFLSKNKEQSLFEVGKPNFFTEVKRVVGDVEYLNIKKIQNSMPKTPFQVQKRQEQARYSGFAMSYAKDLAVAGFVKKKEEMFELAKEMFDFMVDLDQIFEPKK